MIAKLMQRKKSYERIMRAEDPMQGRQNGVMDISGKKDLLVSAQRPGGVSGLNRVVQPSNSTRKQVQYYDSTPQRKGAGTVLKKQLMNSAATGNQSMLDVTG